MEKKTLHMGIKEALMLLEMLQKIREEITEDGVLDDLDLFDSDSICLVEEWIADQVTAVIKAEKVPEPDRSKNQPTSVYLSAIMEAEQIINEILSQRKMSLAQVKAPLQDTIQRLTQMLNDKSTRNINREHLKKSLEIYKTYLARMEK
jgi:hypothetical protein